MTAYVRSFVIVVAIFALTQIGLLLLTLAVHSISGMLLQHHISSTAYVFVLYCFMTIIHLKVKQCRRDFRKGSYREIRKNLAHIDWDEKMKNKTPTECWDILRGELDTAIDTYVPMKKQGKRSKKKHLSKEAFRKMRYKQNMWRVYKHTGKDEDYEVTKKH